MGETKASDMMVGALTDPFDDCPWGSRPRTCGRQVGDLREDQDALAVQSHQRAAKATTEGRFKGPDPPIELKSRKAATTFDTDEHIRADASGRGAWPSCGRCSTRAGR